MESVPGGRDPIALATEKYLRLIEQDGVHELSIKQRKAGIRVRFAGKTAEAENLDTALLRLGSKLLRNSAFREALTKALRRGVAIDDVRFNGAGSNGSKDRLNGISPSTESFP